MYKDRCAACMAKKKAEKVGNTIKLISYESYISRKCLGTSFA